jgi:hypothetical protein
MNAAVPRLVLAALVLPVAALLGACDGDSSVTRIQFSLEGEGRCDGAIVDFHLEGTDIEFARDRKREPDCRLNDLLAGDGCELEFEPVGDPSIVRAKVEGCELDARSILFDCGFKSGDVSGLTDAIDSQCACTTASCESDPRVCPRDQQTGIDCEDCDDGSDDDGDGLEDCEDPACRGSDECAAATTTTVPSTSSTTSTTSPTINCSVTFRLVDDLLVGSLMWTTTFEPGDFVGSGSSVECEDLVEESLSAFNEESEGELRAGVISLEGIAGPRNVAECTVRVTHSPTAGDFTISDIEAATPDLVLIQPDPTIEVANIDCEGFGDPSSTTSSTWPVHTPSTSSTSTTQPPSAYLELHLESSSVPLGALQVSVDYASTSVDIAGTGALAECVNLVPSTLFADNDDEAQRKLGLGFVSVDGFSAPAPLARCAFDGPVPDASAFVVTILDATDVLGEPAEATVVPAVLLATD